MVDKSDVEIFLIISCGIGCWVILKGWLMNGKLVYVVVECEVYEEVGVKGKVEIKLLGIYSYFKGFDLGFEIFCKV